VLEADLPANGVVAATATFSGTTSSRHVAVHCYQHVPQVVPEFRSGTSSGQTVPFTTSTSAALDATNSPTLAVCAAYAGDSGVGFTHNPTASFTERLEQPGAEAKMATADRTDMPAGTTTPGWTVTGTGIMNRHAVAAVLFDGTPIVG
jgi:hypothetical protein